MICELIRDAGWVPAQRNQYYEVLRRHDGAGSPDLVERKAGVFGVRQHKITVEEAAAYKTVGVTGRRVGLTVVGGEMNSEFGIQNSE